MLLEFVNGPGDQGSIPVIPKTQKIALHAALLGTQKYQVGSGVKWSNPENQVAPFPDLGVVCIESGAFWSPSTTVVNLNFYFPQTIFEEEYYK